MPDITPKSFIKNPSLLIENHRIDDLFDIDSIANDFKSKLINAPHKSIMGLIGEYGTGKSTMLYKVSKQIENDFWIEFDAWKYPERKELWEGFVLDFARQIDNKTFESVRQKIDGKQNDDKKTLVNTVGSIPGLAAIKNLTHFYETSPARRTFEIQDILKNLISDKAKDKKIYIVVEDIDRSGDAGIFFLETLKYFLQNLDVPNTIKIIVPIADSKFYDHTDSYIKCLDLVDFYQPSNIKMDKFVESVFEAELIQQPKVKKQLTQLFELLIIEPTFTLRKLKLILRKADLNYINQQVDGFDPDFRMSILFEISKYIDSTRSGKNLFSLYKNKRSISENKLLSTFTYSVATNTELLDFEQKLQNVSQSFKLIERTGTLDQHPSTPYLLSQRFRSEHFSFCCDFYLNY
jgi:KAP-like P-loop domain-containing protein